jgi:CubicO group peptidase (beta-lactamase class C family)
VTVPRPTATLSASEASAISGIEAWLSQLAEDRLFSGSVLVAHQGKVLLSQGYGLADREQRIPNTAQTRFRLGSITKQFTAMAILILQAQGRLHIQDLVCNYIVDCPAAWKAITLEHLLTHTSGIPNFTQFVDFRTWQATPSPPLEVIARFRDRPLDFQPGEEWSYSNSGYTLLGYIIEQASGQSYEAFLQQSILSPLDLHNTGYEHDSDDLAIGYRTRQSTLPVASADMSIAYAGGALYSTVEDLYRWDQALYTTKLLPQAQIDEMFSPHVAIPPGGGWAYGYGWFLRTERDRQLIFHEGLSDGGRSIIARYPDDHVTIIVLSNQQDIPVGSYQEVLSKHVFGEQ